MIMRLRDVRDRAMLPSMSSTDPIRVAIVEDDRGTREGLALLIDGTPGFRCIGTYGSAEDGLQAAQEEAADVLLLDVHLPGMLGSEAVRLFRKTAPLMQIMMLSVYSDDDKVFESICNGACGYMLKKTPPARLLESIREASEGGAPMSPEVARRVVTLFRRLPPPIIVDQQLTPRELEVLSLLADGYSYENVAARIGITVNTVRNYVRSIYETLHVHSKSEAVSKALRAGLLH
jgi:DNA-binding NarL/FixJ family response regulator